jgi:hypothetical protein
MSDDLNMSRFGWFFPIQRPEGGRYASEATARESTAATEVEIGAAIWFGRLPSLRFRRTAREGEIQP